MCWTSGARDSLSATTAGSRSPFDQFLKDMASELYAEYASQECSERHLEGAATPLKEEEEAKPPGTQYLPRGGRSDHQFWSRSRRSMPAHLHRGEKKRI